MSNRPLFINCSRLLEHAQTVPVLTVQCCILPETLPGHPYANTYRYFSKNKHLFYQPILIWIINERQKWAASSGSIVSASVPLLENHDLLPKLNLIYPLLQCYRTNCVVRNETGQVYLGLILKLSESDLIRPEFT